jgi:hypothetical protein
MPVLDSAPRSIAIKESASDDAQFASYLEAMNTNVITPRFDKIFMASITGSFFQEKLQGCMKFARLLIMQFHHFPAGSHRATCFLLSIDVLRIYQFETRLNGTCGSISVWSILSLQQLFGYFSGVIDYVS